MVLVDIAVRAGCVIITMVSDLTGTGLIVRCFESYLWGPVEYCKLFARYVCVFWIFSVSVPVLPLLLDPCPLSAGIASLSAIIAPFVTWCGPEMSKVVYCERQSCQRPPFFHTANVCPPSFACAYHYR